MVPPGGIAEMPARVFLPVLFCHTLVVVRGSK